MFKIVRVGIGVLLLSAVWAGRDYIFSHARIAYKVWNIYRTTSDNGSTELGPRIVLHERKQVGTVTRNTTSRNSESRRCTLTWNVSKINSAVYEADTVVMGEPEASNRSYAPPLLLPDPDIKLSRSAFLLPDLRWGPNNQLIGLMETIFVTIKLNRTLIVPYFTKHTTDK